MARIVEVQVAQTTGSPAYLDESELSKVCELPLCGQQRACNERCQPDTRPATITATVKLLSRITIKNPTDVTRGRCTGHIVYHQNVAASQRHDCCERELVQGYVAGKHSISDGGFVRICSGLKYV